MRVGHQGAAGGQLVDVGGFDLGVASEAADPVVLIVDRDEQDVGLVFGEQRAGQKDQQNKDRPAHIHLSLSLKKMSMSSTIRPNHGLRFQQPCFPS